MSKLKFAIIIIIIGALCPLQSYCEEGPPTCCRKGLVQEPVSKKDCCDTKSVSKQFKQSCCEMDSAESAQTDASTNNERPGKRQGARKGERGSHEVMQNARTLVFSHQSLNREVIEIPGGVRTKNTTTDPSLVKILRIHPKEMVQHLASGGHVREWDPLFAELAKHSDKVKMEFRNLDNGIEVTSTSDDPKVAKLIRAHAYKVSEFVKRGRAAMHEATPLPDDYR